jgi:Uma2 family endonuclease
LNRLPEAQETSTNQKVERIFDDFESYTLETVRDHSRPLETSSWTIPEDDPTEAPGAIGDCYPLAMASPARRRATYEDVLSAPRHKVAEIIDGELRLHPRPAKPHAAAASALGVELGPAFTRGRGGPGGWIILDEPELHLGADILVPDLAGWRRERMPSLDSAAYFTLAPDWVCEVLSESTAKEDRADKLPIYAREKIDYPWLVDPRLRTLEAMRREGAQWLVTGVWKDDARVRAQPFDAFELELAALWADVVLEP